MRLIEAYGIVHSTPVDLDALTVFLASGFNPLHLRTMLAAQLRLRCPEKRPIIHCGTYGDLPRNLDSLRTSPHDVSIVLVEWGDLDARLGLRSLGGWTPAIFADIVGTVKVRCGFIQQAVQRAAEGAPVVVCLPTLPLPPISYTGSWQAHTFDLELRECIASLGASLSRNSSVQVISQQRLDRMVPLYQRLDSRSDLATGFPFTLNYTSAISELIAILAVPVSPKKGLITDLDETLWKGILGEVGSRGVSWDMDHRSQHHGLYQQVLQALSEAGALIAVASKNDPTLVQEVFRREDLHLSAQSIFPMEVHWGPKSESLTRILDRWNVAADSVVFVDDSLMELTEVKSVHPKIKGVRFPPNDSTILQFLEHLRDLFGKSVLLEEDRLRCRSIGRTASLDDKWQTASDRLEFLRDSNAELTLNFDKHGYDPRALQLVNKTNQFHLNGRRYSEAEWRSFLRLPESFVLVVSYRDKYGPLGKVAVLAGRRRARKLFIDVWAMSCRAFSRYIERRCLQEVLAQFDCDEVVFNYLETDKNQPLRNFLAELLHTCPAPHCAVSKSQLLAAWPPTSHTIRDLTAQRQVSAA